MCLLTARRSPCIIFGSIECRYSSPKATPLSFEIKKAVSICKGNMHLMQIAYYFNAVSINRVSQIVNKIAIFHPLRYKGKPRREDLLTNAKEWKNIRVFKSPPQRCLFTEVLLDW